MAETPIEKLLAYRLGKKYTQCRSIPDRNKVLMGELKEILYAEIETLLRLNGMINPPFDPFKIKEIGRVPVRVEYAEDVGSHGAIEVAENAFVVKLSKDLLRSGSKLIVPYRLRSTMAHELMHTFFYDTSQNPPRKLGSGLPSRRNLMMQEELCYFLARNLLMPTFSIKDQFTKRNSLKFPSIDNINYLKSRFVASSDLIAYRLITDLNMWRAIFIKFVKEGNAYRSITMLKSKANKFYSSLKIPRSVPSSSQGEWEKILSEHVLKTAEKRKHKEIAVINGQRIVLESALDSRNPMSIMTLVWTFEKSESTLSDYFD